MVTRLPARKPEAAVHKLQSAVYTLLSICQSAAFVEWQGWKSHAGEDQLSLIWLVDILYPASYNLAHVQGWPIIISSLSIRTLRTYSYNLP